ncbi:hypothetical protein GQ55_9G390500 [Panicum hallii var. hallii]|uniref:Uncharacterized protein n=1 Tax=Panicum hallii var. hallii TaxID=1504633 RepID=A0A2T7C9L8_9POAL|nr:hypothetical protein GQ55_9G390500 [Panicum hallii var. hallii]
MAGRCRRRRLGKNKIKLWPLDRREEAWSRERDHRLEPNGSRHFPLCSTAPGS